jgi:hypothetical protein
MGAALDRVESVYLRVLRAAILVLGTLLLAYAAWLAVASLYNVSRSPESVEEEPASVTADELTTARASTAVKPASSRTEPQANQEQVAFYANFLRQYHELFRSKFESYKQRDDKQLTRDAFDDRFLNTEDRLVAVADGNLDFESDKAGLSGLLAVMTEAADKPLTKERLERYRAAKKVPVQRKVQRTRTTYREGWDQYSTSCAGWFYEPIGCPTRRAVQTPYTETVTSMEFPDGTQSHSELFGAFQEQYLRLLEQRRAENAAKAMEERAQIAAGNEEGKSQFITMLQVFGGFLLLMFFFLLIAIERHQRTQSARVRVDGGLPEPELVPELS